MRILMYGSGVQGSVYGGMLQRHGHAVTFLARGQRAEQLRAGGLVLKGVLGSAKIRIDRPTVIDSLAADDAYDLCFLMVRREQVDSVLPILRSSAIARVVFMHNHASGSESLIDAVGPDRSVIAFPGVGGAIATDGSVTYALIREQHTMVGSTPNAAAASYVARTLRDAGFPVMRSTDPDSWLRRHAVMVAALTGALWTYQCDASKLARSSIGVKDFVTAVREGYRALDKERVAPPSLALRAIFTWVPLRLSVAYWQSYLGGDRGEILFAAHARHAAQEMAIIAGEVSAIMCDTGVATPTFDRLANAIPR